MIKTLLAATAATLALTASASAADVTLRVGERDSVEVTGQRLLDLLAQSRPDLFDPAERARIAAPADRALPSPAEEGTR